VIEESHPLRIHFPLCPEKRKAGGRVADERGAAEE
jgi:hypothetical protein